MHKVQRISSLRAAVSSARNDRKTIGFVPTMGNLHEGHLELVRVAKQKADFVVVSIYVNPTQFGANEDFDNYPSTRDEDARLLAEVGADLLFLPEQQTVYPGEMANQTVVYVPELGDLHCGKDRPQHFSGVTTVVSRLFNMVLPDLAVFGKKDYQQLAIIRRMINDLAFPIEIVGIETIRSEQGLALSSRNGYLTKKELLKAPRLQLTLQNMAGSIRESQKTSRSVYTKIENDAKKALKKSGFEVHYVTICAQSSLMPAQAEDAKLVILAAAQLGKARLIDNLEVELS